MSSSSGVGGVHGRGRHGNSRGRTLTTYFSLCTYSRCRLSEVANTRATSNGARCSRR
jgi:hypothetical protein